MSGNRITVWRIRSPRCEARFSDGDSRRHSLGCRRRSCLRFAAASDYGDLEGDAPMVGTTTKDISGLVGEQAIGDLQSNGVCSIDCQQLVSPAPPICVEASPVRISLRTALAV